MPPRIDPARREIAVGTRRLPFRLDLRNDRVSVTLGGAETAVRPLQWREKVTLARFADLGPEFLRDEMIRLCTVSEPPSPLAAEDAEVLWELAAWMSESPSSAPVPLDSRSLATVTLRLCRAMGLKPADFDSRSAPEVEALWEALGQQAEERVAEEDVPPSGTTRIVIVPDEEPFPGTATVPDGGTVPLDGGRDAHLAAGGTPAVREDGEDVPTQLPAQMPIPAPMPMPAHVAAPQSIGVVAMASARTRTAINAEPPPAVIPSVARDLGGRGAMPMPAAPPTQVPHSTLGMTAKGAMPVPAAPPTQVPRSTLGMTAADVRSDRGWAVVPMPRDVVWGAAVQMPVAASIATALVPEDRESPAPPHDCFEELADRLEQAAAEMGLGEE